MIKTKIYYDMIYEGGGHISKPPLGVLPHKIWRINTMKDRMNDLLLAQERYKKANLTVPQEWIDEYYKLYHIVRKSEKCI